jgi:hypothetical protein
VVINLALIPPYSMLKKSKHRPLQMMLPKGLQNPDYRKLYMGFGHAEAARDIYVILDNGMFESGQSLSFNRLLSLAVEYNVNEVVMPDIRGNYPATLGLQERFFAHWQGQDLPRLRLMAVVHGDMEHVASIAKWAPPNRVVLGFPRRMTEAGNKLARLSLMEQVAQSYGRQFDMHMLGMSRAWPGELLRAVRQFGPMLRGMDTDAPFVYARAGRILGGGDGSQASAVERQDDYFFTKKSEFDKDTLERNLEVIDLWASGMAGPVL